MIDELEKVVKALERVRAKKGKKPLISKSAKKTITPTIQKSIETKIPIKKENKVIGFIDEHGRKMYVVHRGKIKDKETGKWREPTDNELLERERKLREKRNG